MSGFSDWQYEPDLTREERALMQRHVVIAILCCPIYMISPVLFGLLMGPYVMWMVFAAKPALLLPLMIHMMYGSQQRYLALFACFLYSLAHIDSMSRRKILLPFIIYLSALPFFIWYTVVRYRLYGGGIGAGGTFEGLGYYFGISAFFWGFLAIGRMQPTVFKGFVVICFVDFVIHFLFFMSIPFTRFLFWSFPFLIILAFWAMLQKVRKWKYSWGLMGICTFAIMILGFFGVSDIRITFTIVGITGLGIVYMIMAKYAPRVLWLLSPCLILSLLTVWMFHTMNKWYVNERGHGSSISYNEIVIRDMESFRYKLFRKTMTDRAPLWYASWDAIKQQFARHPIWVDVEAPVGEYTLDDGRTTAIRLSAHNMLLEMLRLYGAWGGLVLYLVFVIIPSMKIIRDSLRYHAATPYAPILACCLAHIVVGGQTGQYPISPQFTIYLFGLMGVCAGHRFVASVNVANSKYA